MAKKWEIKLNNQTVTSLTSDTLSYEFPKNDDPFDRIYTVSVTDDMGCSTSKDIKIRRCNDCTLTLNNNAMTTFSFGGINGLSINDNLFISGSFTLKYTDNGMTYTVDVGIDLETHLPPSGSNVLTPEIDFNNNIGNTWSAGTWHDTIDKTDLPYFTGYTYEYEIKAPHYFYTGSDCEEIYWDTTLLNNTGWDLTFSRNNVYSARFKTERLQLTKVDGGSGNWMILTFSSTNLEAEIEVSTNAGDLYVSLNVENTKLRNWFNSN